MEASFLAASADPGAAVVRDWREYVRLRSAHAVERIRPGAAARVWSLADNWHGADGCERSNALALKSGYCQWTEGGQPSSVRPTGHSLALRQAAVIGILGQSAGPKPHGPGRPRSWLLPGRPVDREGHRTRSNRTKITLKICILVSLVSVAFSMENWVCYRRPDLFS